MRFSRLTMCSLLMTSLLLAPSVASADDALIGTWRVESSIHNGAVVAEEVGDIITIDAGTFVAADLPNQAPMLYEVDADASPKKIDFSIPVPEVPALLGIYKIEENTLTICINNPFADAALEDYPTEFSSTAENQRILQTFSRVEE